MKPLGNGNYIIRPFKAYKNQSYTYTYYSGSDASGSINIDEALSPDPQWIWSGSRVSSSEEPRNIDGIYKKALYASVLNLFYATGSESMSLFENDQSRLFAPTNSLYIVNVVSQAYGERINPGSFVLTIGTSSIVDDGIGRLYIRGGSGDIIGNIFYGLGVAVINKMGADADGGAPI